MKKTPYETDVIRTRVRMGKGSAHFDPEDRAFATQINSIMARSALAKHDANELQTLTAGKAVGVRRSFGFETMTLSGSTVPSDFELQMKLLAAHAVDPAFRDQVVDNFQKQIRQVWSKFRSTPGGAAGIDIPPILFSDHPTSRHPEEADVIRVNTDELAQWYARNVQDGAIEIAVVGDIDEETVIDVVAKTFGTLPQRPDPVVEIPAYMLDYSFPEGRTRPYIVPHSGEPDTAMVRVFWPVSDHADTMTDRELSLLSNVLDLELTERLREQEGATYSPSSFVSLPEHKDDWGYVAVSVEVAPGEVGRVTELIEDAGADLARDGVSADVFDRAIKPVLEGLETSLENNNFWLGLADEAQSDPESLDRYRSRLPAYQNMTAANISEQAKTVFDPEAAIRVHVLPEE